MRLRLEAASVRETRNAFGGGPKCRYMVTRVPDPFGDILMVPRGRPRPDGELLPRLFAKARIERLDTSTLRRVGRELGISGSETDVRRALDTMLAREELVAVRKPRRRVVVQLETPEILLPPPGVEEEEKHDIGLMLLDPWGWPLEIGCCVTRPQETDAEKITLASNPVRFDAKRYGTCEIDFTGLDDLPRLDEPPAENPDAHPPTDRFTVRDRQQTFRKHVRSPAYVFQLERLQATVVELEHFTENGAVFLPGFSPAKLREGAPLVTGIEALKKAFQLAKGKEHVLVTGHHATLSEQRARNVQFLLTGNQFGWTSLCASAATDADKKELREWASEPLPENDAEWMQDTWDRVWDLIAKELAPKAAPKAKRHKLVVRGPEGEKESIHPVKMAEITFGWQDAGRHTELEPLNPHLCKDHHWNIGPHDEILMPESWPPKPLRDRGFKVVEVDDGDAPSVPAPHLAPECIRAVGCDDRHLAHPYEDAIERRAIERHVEVMVLPDDANVCEHGGGCTTSTCEVYDPRAFELAYAVLAPPAYWQLVVQTAGAAVAAVAGADVLVFRAGGSDGQLVLRTTSGAGGIRSLEGLEPGSYRIVASDVREGSAEVDVTITAGFGTVIALLKRELTWHLPVPPGLSDVELRIFDLADQEVQRSPVSDGAFDLSQLDAMTPVRLGLWTGKLQLGLETELTPGPLAHYLATRDSEGLKSALRSVASPRHLKES